MAFVLRADRRRTTLRWLVALGGIALGAAAATGLPETGPHRMVAVTIPLLLSALSLGETYRRAVRVDREVVVIRRLWRTNSIAVRDIVAWKIKGHENSASLYFRLGSGRLIAVHDLGLLGVDDLGEVSRRLTAMFGRGPSSIDVT